MVDISIHILLLAGLEIGDIIFRDVIDGDYTYLNRQPTLERSSMCVPKAMVIKNISILAGM